MLEELLLQENCDPDRRLKELRSLLNVHTDRVVGARFKTSASVIRMMRCKEIAIRPALLVTMRELSGLSYVELLKLG